MDKITVEGDGETYELEVIEEMNCEKCGARWNLGFKRDQKTCPDCGHPPSRISPTQVIVEPPSRAMDDISTKEELSQQFEERADYLNRTAKAIRALDEEWEYIGANLLDAGILRNSTEVEGVSAE
jgi:predicted  nucleic acid-binding Zn-ribbon protein